VPAARVGEIEHPRRQRLSGPKIAARLGIPCSTVGLILRRLGLGRLKAPEAPVAVIRYERARPRELIHIGTGKLGRIDGIALGRPTRGQRRPMAAGPHRDAGRREERSCIRHIRTRPYTPRANGKAECFIQSSLREWAMPSLTCPQGGEPTPCQAGSMPTTSQDLAQPSKTARPSPG
jgi:hypothetical protein